MADRNSTALITGGTSGIGLATAKKLAQLRIHVVVVGRNENRGKRAVDEIRAAGGEADFISSDLRDAASVREVAKRAVSLGNGRVDILIDNAGVFPFGPTDEMTEEQFDSVYSLNVKAPYFLTAELAPLMAKRGKGAIVNVSTMVADYGAPGMSLYGSSKAAINLLTKTWAAEYGPKGVRVNVVSNNWLPRRPPADQQRPMRLRKQSSSWRQTVAVSFTARSSQWMEGAPRSERQSAIAIAECFAGR
jgi:NAD(P)-dependent dehydrogenase (short-subunit alcohol dehydrogenase family)